MTASNKLRLAILAILASQHAAAITLQPLKVMSSSGELLYAEMNFSRANSDTALEVGLATTNELQQLGINSQAPAGLNFYTRRIGAGNGVIVITSSRPLLDSELNIVLKVKDGDNTRLQQIKAPIKSNPNLVTGGEKPLTPQFIVNEQDLGLNLPQSTQFNTASSTQPTIEAAASSNNTAAETVPFNNAATSSDINTAIMATPVVAPAAVTSSNSLPNLTIRETRRNPNDAAPAPLSENKLAAAQTPATQSAANQNPANQNPTTQAKTAAETAVKPTTKASESRQQKSSIRTNGNYVVQRNDSLWAIANRIAAQTKQPVNSVMQRLQQQNQHAFVNGNANRLRQGVSLNLAAANSNKSKNTSKANKPQKALAASKPATQANNAKIKLKEAELKLVAENDNQSTQRGNKQSAGSEQSNALLGNQVSNSRQNALKMQKQVTGLELGLRQKEQRLQLLNSRLAQLEQQLKQQSGKPAAKPAGT